MEDLPFDLAATPVDSKRRAETWKEIVVRWFDLSLSFFPP